MRPPLLFEALRVTCLHVVLEHVNGSSLIFFIILVSVQRSEESFRYTQLVEVVVGLLQNVNVIAVSHVAAECENAGISRNSPFEHA